ncbi:MAG: hypothetical protein HUJ68_10505 [Clostridia bacterium]|nr:hypothetical protein [Clostridia bacterium]
MICAIVDSGINEKYISNKRIVGGKGFCIENYEVKATNEIMDEDGHGSACFHVLNKNTLNCDFYIIKILNNGVSDARLLCAALHHCLEINADVVNLSLSIINVNRLQIIDELEKVIKTMTEKNMIIVASYPNGNIEGYPASCKNVIGIRGGISFDENYCNVIRTSDGKLNLVSNILPVITIRENGNHYFFGGNSKATAMATARIIEILQKSKEFNKDCLYNNPKWISNEDNETFRDYDYLKEMIDYNITPSQLHKQVFNIITELTGCKIEMFDNLIMRNVVSPTNILSLVIRLEQELEIEINDENLRFDDFICVDNIVKMVIKNGKHTFY